MTDEQLYDYLKEKGIISSVTNPFPVMRAYKLGFIDGRVTQQNDAIQEALSNDD